MENGMPNDNKDYAKDIADWIVDETDLARAEELSRKIEAQFTGYANGEIACALAGAINGLCDAEQEFGDWYLSALFIIASRQSVHNKT
jgi:hypothetical protein